MKPLRAGFGISSWPWVVGVGLVLLFAPAEPASAQSKTATAPAVTQQAVDQVIDAISDAVVEKLRKDGVVAEKPAAPPVPPSEPDADVVADKVVALSEQAEVALSGYPDLGHSIARIPALLDKSESGGRGLGSFIAMLSVAVGAALLAEVFLRMATAGVRRKLAARIAGTTRFWPFAGLASLDALGVMTVWLVGYGLLGVWFRGTDEQARLAAAVVSAVALWRLTVLVLRVFLRPELPVSRLAALRDSDASAIYWRLATVLAVVMASRLTLRVLIAIETPPDALSAWMLTTSIVALGLFLWAAYSLREPVAAWLESLLAQRPAGHPPRALVRNWFLVAVPFLAVLWLAQVYGAISHNVVVPGGLLLTLTLLIALLLFETLLDFIARRIAGIAADPVRPKAQTGAMVVRCVRVAVYLVVVISIIGTWIVDVLGLVDSTQWRSFSHAAITVGMVLFLSYVCWEAIYLLTDGARGSSSTPGTADEDAAAPPSATRLATILPLLRMAATTVVFVVAVLVVLSELGVNITPLIAAVSVLGLAVSFGSQTLVRDIVSGIFYLADDAFRVGEYIDCVKAKGTVEGFTLRSIRLRHQNGQIFTIPFGQLGQITNFSRDWCTMKFNMRFARDTDVEKLRKVVKKVGLEMMQEPEFKDEFLAPLKLQGVADVADNALVMRFKFTSKPNIPTVIQREAMKRLFLAFQGAGIEFASATISVQTLGGAIDAQAAAGAAASAAAAAQATPAQ